MTFVPRILTTIEMATNSTTDTSVNIAAAKGHPVSRLYLPPLMMTTKVTRPPKHNRVVKEAKKPTVLHMEQKYRSPPSHRSLGGKSRQYGSSNVEQLLCRPICLSMVSPVAEVTE
jgi:hypothetical protein